MFISSGVPKEIQTSTKQQPRIQMDCPIRSDGYCDLPIKDGLLGRTFNYGATALHHITDTYDSTIDRLLWPSTRHTTVHSIYGTAS